MTHAQQLRAALTLCLTKDGHLPVCGHRQWLFGYCRTVRHACDLDDCDGEGAPCSRKCAQVRAALLLDVDPARLLPLFFDEEEIA